MYIYCVVWYRVIAAVYVRGVGHVFTYLYLLMMIWNAQWTMRRLYSLMFFLANIKVDLRISIKHTKYLDVKLSVDLEGTNLVSKIILNINIYKTI